MKTTFKVGRENITVLENLWDKVVRVYDPIKGKERFKAKCMSALAGGYSGASKSRRSMSEWNVSTGDADADILPDLPTLRQRSSDLTRNVPIATSAVNTAVTNVIGTGLKLQSRIDREFLNLTDDQADALEASIEREFKLWAESKDCDAARSLDFYGHQSMAFLSALERGDVFYLTPRINRINSPYKLALQAIEADRVTNKDWKTDTSTLGGGIQVDKYGAPVAYHILKTHPGGYRDSRAEWVVVNAFGSRSGRRNVIHLFDMKRPGQKRGVPYLAPVMESLKQLGRYTEAELMAAVVSGMFTVFVESEGTGLDVLADQTQSNSDDLALGNGMIVDLAPGEKVSTANPGRPNTAFDPFVLAIQRQIGSALEIPHELIIKAFNSSYSASKAAFIEAWKFFRTRRAWMVRGFCNPIYELWMDEAVASGRLSMPGYFKDPMIKKAYLGSQWIGPGRGSIQEHQEVAAAIQRIDAGLSTRAQEAAEMHGGDFDVIHRQLVKENNMRKEGGLTIDPMKIMDEKQDSEKEDKKDKKDPEKKNKEDAVIKYLATCEVSALSSIFMMNDFVKQSCKFYNDQMTHISSRLNINIDQAKLYVENAKAAVASYHNALDVTGFNDWCGNRYSDLVRLRNMPSIPVNNVYVPETKITVNNDAPIVNVPQPVVNVENNVTAPDVNVTVEAAEPPAPTPVTVENIVNVEPTPVTVENNIDVKPTPVTVENTVNVPKPGDSRVIFTHDANDNIKSAVITNDD